MRPNGSENFPTLDLHINDSIPIVWRLTMFFDTAFTIARCVALLLALTSVANAQGGVNAIQNKGFLGPVGGGGGAQAPANAPNAANNASAEELGHFQSIREDALQAMEKKLKLGGFQTAHEIVAEKVAAAKPAPPAPPADNSGLAGELAAFVKAAEALVKLKLDIDSAFVTPPSVAKITTVVSDFEIALAALTKLKVEKPDQLASDLLRRSIKTIDTTDLKPASILPALMKSFFDDLGLNKFLDVVSPQAASAGRTPSQYVFDDLLTKKDLHAKAKSVKSK